MTTPEGSSTELAARLLSEALRSEDPLEQAADIAAVLHRASVELLKLARTQATATKGEPEWGSWAGLQNTTRSLVLQASTCRDLIGKIKKG
jgi:hypothetical protein